MSEVFEMPESVLDTMVSRAEKTGMYKDGRPCTLSGDHLVSSSQTRFTAATNSSHTPGSPSTGISRTRALLS